MPYSARPNIAVAFDLNFQNATEIFEGISAYCRENQPWNLIPLNFGFEELLVDLATSRKIDGMIGSFVSDAWIRALGGPGLVIVNVSNISRIEAVTTVSVDEEAIGAIAATAFIDANLGHYAFAGNPGYYFSQARENGYRTALDLSGCKCLTSPSRPGPAWERWLADLPLPVGIFCADDYTARRLALACRKYGINVPGDVAIIGVGNSAVDSIFAGLPLSSIELPNRKIGESAAHLLAMDLARGSAPVTPHRVTLPPGALLRRESSLRPGPGGPDAAVERALNHIRENLSQPISVDLLARVAPVSRRSLEITFRRNLQSSPYEEITRQRMDLAKTLLEETPSKIYAVGTRCGYPEQHQFSAAFRKRCGVSPREWRRGMMKQQCP